MRLSNSKAKVWRRCPNKFRYKYVEKLEPKQKKVALERGSWVHDLLQHYYDGEDWMARHRELAKEFYANTFEEEREEFGDLPVEIKDLMNRYLYHYRHEKLVVVDSELHEIITLPNGLEFELIIDLITEDPDGGLWIWDHKTVKKFFDEDFKMLDPQLTRYFYGAEFMGYKPLRGAIFNEIRTKPPTQPEVLQSGRLTTRQNLDCDYATYYRAIRRLGQDPVSYREVLKRLSSRSQNFFRRTQLPKDPPVTRTMMRELGMTANEILRAERRNEYPRTTTKDCKWDCEYRDLCQIELFGGDPSSIIKHQFQKRRRPE